MKIWLSACIVLVCWLNPNPSVARDRQENEVTVVSLELVVDRWSLHAPDAEIEKLNHLNELLQFQNYKKSFLPSLAFQLNPFNFNRSLKLIQHPDDGGYSYVEDFSNSTATGIVVNQKVGWTGGEITLGSNLNYFSDFSLKNNTFSTAPFYIGYNQQLFGGYRNYTLEKKIQYLKNEVSVKKYCTRILSIQRQTLNLFMTALQAELEKELALKNRFIYDTLLSVSKIKLDNGGITEYEYQQIELQALNNQYIYENSQKNYRDAIRKLLTYVDRTTENEIRLETPDFDLPLRIDETQVFHYVEKNNPQALETEEKQLAAEKELLSGKLANRFNGNISLNYGINQYAETFIDAYKRPNVRQSATISFQFPIFQWGINRNKIKIAENQYRSALLSIRKENSDFYNQVRESVDNYNHQVDLWIIARKTFELSQKQYELAAQKYALGKISVYDFTTSRQEQAAALERYYQSIRDVWDTYFYLRQITLYDFAGQEELIQKIVTG